jgi:hypothetical protein
MIALLLLIEITVRLLLEETLLTELLQRCAKREQDPQEEREDLCIIIILKAIFMEEMELLALRFQ